ncbi:MAG: thiamine ABC transporter substrate binding subunit [Halanaeroarchaeum sp.]
MTGHRSVSRRRVLTGAGSLAVGGLAGCIGGPATSSPDTIRVGTYPAYVDAPSTSPGAWVKAEFERRHDATLEWVAPDNELTTFIQRRRQGAPLEADLYLGVTPQHLVRAQTELDQPLFEGFDVGAIDNARDIQDVYHFDPKRRVLPIGASYVAIVYDETAVDAPPTFASLTDPAYEDALLLPNPQSTTTGLLFLLWSIHTVGRDRYLEYWNRLMDNGVHVLGSWSSAYTAYSNAEASMVVSYSTDQVYAANANADMSRHQIAFLNDQGYAYVDGLGKFATTERDDLVRRFAEFMLSPEVQRKTAVKNVGIPAVSGVSLPEQFRQYAKVPENPVQYPLDVLAAHMDEWRETWARRIVSG